MNVWNEEEIIIDDSGKKSTCELFLTERIPDLELIKRSVTIKDGKVVNKPEDVDIIGKRTSKGFILKGIEINTERTKKCSMCGKYKNIKLFWDKETETYSNLCNECRENAIDTEEQQCTDCWIR